MISRLACLFGGRRLLAGAVAAVALAFPAAALADTVVTYFNGVAVAATAYTNGVLGYKTYNEMFASSNTTSGEAVGIYLLTSGGSKIRAYNGLGWVAWGPVADANAEYARAYCWNRYTSIMEFPRFRGQGLIRRLALRVRRGG